MRETVAVIDYGMGNLHSVTKALRHVADETRYHVKIVTSSDDVMAAQRVVFPGVGAIQNCMAELERLDIIQAIIEAIAVKPVLAICVGMQALMAHSDENNGVDCLSVVPGRVQHFSRLHADDTSAHPLKVPHMGWNQVNQRFSHPLWEGIAQDSRFYFVHSYFVQPHNTAIIAGETRYGGQFTAAMAIGNLFAVQFHPEKSQHAGLQLLGNFLRWNGSN